ncbi:hypothetical protein FMEXI_3665 [Fusarium mexicanum]|uniref:F-box domain-containing protein n=1 Tax=Fusarium mexicanum TaxID=751941 RepID=A0A8H5J9M9_9HYPO|nr:hypothetical protein FMEXI_3665 [Fusarium mexicanum]
MSASLYTFFATTIGVPIVVMLFIRYVSHVITWQRDIQNSGRGYEDAMRRADAETNDRESAIELSLWKKPPSSTLGNGLPHRTQLIHDHVPLSSPEASRLEKLPEEILSMIISWLSKGDSEGGLALFALRQVSRHFRRLTEGAEFKTHYFSTHFCCPQALATKLPGGMTVVLIFWRGHSGGDPSVFHSSGYLYKKKLKEAIQNIRLQGGRHMIPQRGVNAMAEWDSIAEIDGSESISPDLIKLRGGWACQDPGHPHVCSPFRTLKVAYGHCEKAKGCIVMASQMDKSIQDTKLVEQLFLDLPINDVLHPPEWAPVVEPWASSYVNSIRESRFGDAIWARYQMLGQVVDGLCRGKTIIERITEDAMGYKKYSSEFYAAAVAFYRANNSSSDGHPEVIEIILRVDTEDLTGKHIPEGG